MASVEASKLQLMPDNIRRSAELQQEAKAIGRDFIFTDLDTAITFARAALEAGDDEKKRERNRKNAEAGFDAVTHFVHRLKPGDITESEVHDIETKLNWLKSALEKLK